MYLDCAFRTFCFPSITKGVEEVFTKSGEVTFGLFLFPTFFNTRERSKHPDFIEQYRKK